MSLMNLILFVQWYTLQSVFRSAVGDYEYIDGSSAGQWWDGEIACLRSTKFHLATVKSADDLADFTSECANIGSDATCWIGYNNYYSDGDNEWFWLSDGGSSADESSLIYGLNETFFTITGLNVNDSNGDTNVSCIYYDNGNDNFMFDSCINSAQGHYFICDSQSSGSKRFVSLPMKMNWFDAQSFCMYYFFVFVFVFVCFYCF